MFNQAQTYLLFALGLSLALFMWMDPLLFEFISPEGSGQVVVTNSWTYEVYALSQHVKSYPNYWLIGGYLGVAMVWAMALMTYNRPRLQFYWVLALVAILMGYFVNIMATLWVYKKSYYPISEFESHWSWPMTMPLLLAACAGLVARYVYTRLKQTS